MRFLLCFCFLFFSFNCFSKNYAKVSEVENGLVKTVKTVMPKTGNWIELPRGYNSKYFEIRHELVDDKTKPNWEAASEIEPCSDEQDCNDIKLSKECPEFYQSFISQDFTSVYCTRIVSYQKKKGSKKIVKEIPSKKSSYMAKAISEKKSASLVAERLRDMAMGKTIYAAIQIGNKTKGLTKKQRRSLRKTLAELKEDLMDGNLCEVKQEVSSLVADGVLITEQDKLLVISKIDSYKTCL